MDISKAKDGYIQRVLDISRLLFWVILPPSDYKLSDMTQRTLRFWKLVVLA